MIEDGMIRLYNKSNERVTKVINGTRISIPAHGSASVSERKGNIMLETFPEQLTEDSQYDKRIFTVEEMEAVKGLDHEALLQVVYVLMSGMKPDIMQALRDSEARKNESLTKKVKN